MDRLLVALDVASLDQARSLANQLRGSVGGFKIGSQLFTSVGPAFVEELVGRGDRVFLDLKFHDIPHTVAGAIAAATRIGVWMVTVHAAGGADMMRAARAAADEEAVKRVIQPPLIVAVTVLTSIDQQTLATTGVAGHLDEHVARLALLAQASALDGAVASPQEISLLRACCDPRFALVTPGIRSAGDDSGDQRRTATPSGALSAGASYIVVGRSIIGAPDPRAAAERIAEECREPAADSR
ncbi:MAG: orotidine-5'-phosphate decarboxylase [Luteitalea sp.]|nr:orotidine-5'-phosphate decarboxylase [Luteitalea sp.]